MTPSEDIADDLEPEPASASSAPEPRARARPLRGHHPKIDEAVAELRAEGLLVPNMRPCHRDKLVMNRLDEKGHRGDPVSRKSLYSYFKKEPF
jgi:hypothetical protein